MAGFSNTDNNLSQGIKATHITPEQGDTAGATTGGPSAAGVKGEASPPPAAGIGKSADDGKRLDHEDRSFEAGDKSQDA